MQTDVAVLPTHEVVVTSEQTELIKRTICQGATDAEMQLFFYDCRRRGVHPLDKLIHFTKRSGKYTPITSIDFFRQRAQESRDFAGEDEPVYTTVESGAVDTCKYTVYRFVHGERCKWTATARWDEYYPGEQMGFMWKKMPYVMLTKCAEALALRKAFPAELQGLYVKEEMDQAGPEQRPLRTPSQILAESEKKAGATADTTAGGKAAEDGLEGSLKDETRRPVNQDASLPPSLMPAYLDQIALSQSVAECSKTLNTALKDTTLTVFETTQLQEAGKKKIVELRGKK